MIAACLCCHACATGEGGCHRKKKRPAIAHSTVVVVVLSLAESATSLCHRAPSQYDPATIRPLWHCKSAVLRCGRQRYVDSLVLIVHILVNIVGCIPIFVLLEVAHQIQTLLNCKCIQFKIMHRILRMLKAHLAAPAQHCPSCASSPATTRTVSPAPPVMNVAATRPSPHWPASAQRFSSTQESVFNHARACRSGR